MTILEWEGAHNARALRGGMIVRSGSLDRMTERGWAAALSYGIRTVIDLRNADELSPDATVAPPGIARLRIPLDQIHVRAFWDLWDKGPEFGTPLYFQPHLERFPEANADVIRAIASAAPGGVVFHCGAGRDRAGQMAMLVLHVLGASADEIADDYVLSYGHSEHDDALRQFLVGRGTTAREELARVLREVDVLAILRRGGVTDADVAALRGRAT